MNTQEHRYNVPQQISEIKEYGYTILPNIITTQSGAELLSLVKKYYEETKDKICQEAPYLNRNQPNLYNLQNKDLKFIHTLLDIQELKTILIHFLNDKWYRQIPQDKPNYILRSFGARSSEAALPLHIDSFIPYHGDEVIAMQVAIVLEDMKEENGCTIVVPGSHQSGKYADRIHLKNSILLTPKAGDLVIWDSRLWHGTTENISNKTRWAIVSTFTRWWIKQHFNIPNSLSEEFRQNLTPEQRSILGFASIPFDDEYKGIDLKRGYENL